MQSAMAMNLDLNLRGLHAAAIQLISKQHANTGKFAINMTQNIKRILYLKLISCEISTGTMAKIAISCPSTKICHGYSKMLTPETIACSNLDNEGEVIASKLNDHIEPVITFDQKKHVTAYAINAKSQYL